MGTDRPTNQRAVGQSGLLSGVHAIKKTFTENHCSYLELENLGFQLNTTGYPWTNALSTKELSAKKMATCGYPGDKNAGTMWRVDGDIHTVNDQRIFYMADTFGGQSGSPVYVDIGKSIVTFTS